MRRKRLAVIGAVCLAATLALGIGQASGEGAKRQEQSALVKPATRLRTLQAGDEWQYTIKMTGSSEGSGENIVSVAKATVGDEAALAMKNSVTVEGQGTIFTMYYRQKPGTGDLLLVAGADGKPIHTPAFALPGVWNAQVSKITQMNGATASIVVLGSETVAVPVGKFATWRVRQTQSGPVAKVNGIYWYAPEIGYFVKARYKTTFLKGDLAGLSFDYELELKSTSVLPNKKTQPQPEAAPTAVTAKAAAQ